MKVSFIQLIYTVLDFDGSSGYSSHNDKLVCDKRDQQIMRTDEKWSETRLKISEIDKCTITLLRVSTR